MHIWYPTYMAILIEFPWTKIGWWKVNNIPQLSTNVIKYIHYLFLLFFLTTLEFCIVHIYVYDAKPCCLQESYDTILRIIKSLYEGYKYSPLQLIFKISNPSPEYWLLYINLTTDHLCYIGINIISIQLW